MRKNSRYKLFRKVNLSNSKPFAHFHIQNYSLTNSILKFKAILRSQFSKNNFPEYLSITSSNFCRTADLPHIHLIYRSSFSQMLFIIDVLKSFTIFWGKYLCSNLFLIKFIEKKLQLVFSCKYCTIFKNNFFAENLLWLLLDSFLACESSHLAVFQKKGVLRNFAKFARKHTKEKKETLTEVFSCEFYKTYKNSFSYRIPLPPPPFWNRKHRKWIFKTYIHLIYPLLQILFQFIFVSF